MGDRIDRIESLLVSEISQALLRDVQNPHIGYVTVTRAEVSRDLAQAKVFVSVFGEEAQRKETLDALQRSAGYLKQLLGKRLHLKRIPRLIFVEDSSLRQADRLSKILKEE